MKRGSLLPTLRSIAAVLVISWLSLHIDKRYQTGSKTRTSGPLQCLLNAVIGRITMASHVKEVIHGLSGRIGVLVTQQCQVGRVDKGSSH